MYSFQYYCIERKSTDAMKLGKNGAENIRQNEVAVMTS